MIEKLDIQNNFTIIEIFSFGLVVQLTAGVFAI